MYSFTRNLHTASSPRITDWENYRVPLSLPFICPSVTVLSNLVHRWCWRRPSSVAAGWLAWALFLPPPFCFLFLGRGRLFVQTDWLRLRTPNLKHLKFCPVSISKFRLDRDGVSVSFYMWLRLCSPWSVPWRLLPDRRRVVPHADKGLLLTAVN
jgi:hypothetical protein